MVDLVLESFRGQFGERLPIVPRRSQHPCSTALMTSKEVVVEEETPVPYLSCSRIGLRDVVLDPLQNPIHCLVQPSSHPALQSDSLYRACGCIEVVRLHWGG